MRAEELWSFGRVATLLSRALDFVFVRMPQFDHTRRLVRADDTNLTRLEVQILIQSVSIKRLDSP